MVQRPSVLCAVDFSAASRGALRYAAALAEHFFASLTVVTVNHRFLNDAAAAALGETWLQFETEQMLEHFVHDSFPGRTPQLAELRRVVVVGEPAAEILRLATDTSADVIVMSTHGTSGVEKLIFGSTTERVLRQSGLPVIVTPAADPGPETLDDWRGSVKCVLAPIDLSRYSTGQLSFAAGLADALCTPIVITHVVEPLSHGLIPRDTGTSFDAARHVDAHRQVELLAAGVSPQVNLAIVIGSGDPAAEIARIAKQHAAGVIVMALHTAPQSGHRIGTVTYRLLCQSSTVVIACPPSLFDREGFNLTRASCTGRTM